MRRGYRMDFREDTFMLILGLIVIAFILAQSIFFLVKAIRRGKEIGMAGSVMKNTVVQSILFTITPALAIVATVVALAPALGIILPWIRLSEAVSSGNLATPITDKHVFSVVAWVMTLASSLPLVVLPLCLKRLQKGMNKAMSKAGDAKLTDSLAAAAFIGLIGAFIARALAGKGTATQLADGTVQMNYDGAGILSVATLLVAIVVMLLLSKLAEKKNIGWLQNFAMPISMFVAMGAAIALFHLLPESLATFEFRAPVVS